MGQPTANVLSAKDVNTSMANTNTNTNNADGTIVKPNIKSMEYHRQMLKSKMEEEKMKQYTSPSDNIMSPCTAKLSALKGRQAGKSKPKSLFAQTSAKKLDGENVLGAKSIPSPSAAPQGNPLDDPRPSSLA